MLMVSRLGGPLVLLATLLVVGCSARSVPPAVPGGVSPPGVPAPAGTSAAPWGAGTWSGAATPDAARPLVATALALVGAPYQDGGSGPGGFDCSGFVHYVFGRHGWRVPRTVAAQYSAGNPVAAGDVRPGDLLFFATLGSGPTHVAIALEGGRFVHAPSGRGRVRIDSFVGRYWPPRFLGARRLVRSG